MHARPSIFCALLLASGCGSSGPAPAHAREEAAAAEPPAAPAIEAPASEPEAEPPAEPLPEAVAAIASADFPAGWPRRAWLAHAGPLRLAPDDEPLAETQRADGALRPDSPSIVLEHREDAIRIVQEAGGMRLLLWIRAQDAALVPVEPVALRRTARAPAPGPDDDAVRVYPGHRFHRIEAPRGELGP